MNTVKAVHNKDKIISEMKRLHELTAKKEDIGINVLRLHKHYKRIRRMELAASALRFITGCK